MRLRVVPYKPGSESARLLSTELEKLLNYKVFRGPPKENRVNINWGSQTRGPNQVQSPAAIEVASDKLKTFQVLKEANVTIPPFTTSKQEAASWLTEKTTVVARRLLRASSGRGIVLATTPGELPDAPLYVKYIPKKKEFRVHVVNGEVIDVQEKRQRKDWTGDRNTKIRNLDNGYVFCHEGIVEPESLRNEAIRAIEACKLAFGAADIVYNEKANTCYVLEINTAPGLCETTAIKYANAFVKHFTKLGRH